MPVLPPPCKKIPPKHISWQSGKSSIFGLDMIMSLGLGSRGKERSSGMGEILSLWVR